MRDARRFVRNAQQQFDQRIAGGEEPGGHRNGRKQRHHPSGWKDQRIGDERVEHARRCADRRIGVACRRQAREQLRDTAA